MSDPEDLVGLLRGTYLFRDLDDAIFAELVAACTRTEVPRGAEVAREGTPGEAMYIVVAGAFEARAARADGGEAVLGVMRRGEHFGEIALIERTPRTASVRAQTDGVLAALARDDLQRLIDRQPQLAEALAAGLRTRVAWWRSGWRGHARIPARRVVGVLPRRIH